MAGEPANEAAVDHRNALDEQQIREPQRAALLIDSAVRSLLAIAVFHVRSGELAAAQIERCRAVDEERRRDDFAAVGNRAELAAQLAQIAVCVRDALGLGSVALPTNCG